MKLHTLKIKEIYYIQIVTNRKTFEIRKNDRDFQVGDLINFTKTNGKEFSTLFENPILQIIDVFQEEGFGLENGFCILSFKKL